MYRTEKNAVPNPGEYVDIAQLAMENIDVAQHASEYIDFLHIMQWNI